MLSLASACLVNFNPPPPLALQMSLCGRVQQNDEIVFHAYDNLKRANATVTALVHLGQESRYLDVSRLEGTFNQYEFKFAHRQRGVAILEVSFDGIQIPESPFRIEVIERECPGTRMVAVSTELCFVCWLFILYSEAEFIFSTLCRK